jgi:hypothetical protein
MSYSCKKEGFELFVSDTCIANNASTTPNISVQITQLRLRFFGPEGRNHVP